ncbi:MAG: HDIG domain-containing protein [Deltaproteobacteria bacterium]|nr:HDIG domain-containing protein [Deltaproteobacteria bacterium]
MAEKETPGKIGRLYELGSSLRSRCERLVSAKSRSSRHYARASKIALLLALCLCITFILAPQPQRPLKKYREGDISQEDVKAIRNFLVEDVETTAKRRKELLAEVPPVYDLDEQAAARIQERLHGALMFMRREFRKPAAASGQAPPDAALKTAASSSEAVDFLKLRAEFNELLGVEIPPSTFNLLVKSEFSPTIEALVNQVISQFCQQGVIASHSLPKPEPEGILLRRLPSRQEQVIKPPYHFLEVDNIRKPVASYCREVAADFSPSDRWLACDLVQYLLAPNVTFNLAETQERQQVVLRALRPSYFHVKRGEYILRAGERLTPIHLAKLKAQSLIYPQSQGILIFLGIFISLTIFFWLTYNLSRVSLKRFPTKLWDLTFLAALLLGATLLNLGLLQLGDLIGQVAPQTAGNLVYGWPIALAPMFAALFLGLETGVVIAFLTAILSALLLDKPFPMFLYFLSAGFVGIWGVRHCRQRGDIIRAGLTLSLVNFILLTAMKLVEYPFTAKELFIAQVFGLGGGMATAILVLGVTPLIEWAFGYTSDIRLLELLNLDQPVLRELMLLAPGTYHHSLMVGQMVEAAAEGIGANPLVAKAAAYYHDIGKVKKPAYFVENQLGGENKHEKLAPSMSSLILISHVKDGVDLARKHGLGERLVDIIQQHHGTSLISYFYHKAKNHSSNPGQVNIDDYRYPGPRPQTKEAGLVLIADQVEAASKTLTEPTPARIQGMVQKIVNNIFADGQLDECELTLKELHLIAKHCNKILSGIFHQRILYPQPAEKIKANGDLDKQSTKKNGSKSGEPQDKGREDLRRLGLVRSGTKSHAGE